MENKQDSSSISLSNCLFASMWARFFARLLDLVIVSAIVVSLSIAILITDKKFDWKSLQLDQPIRYFVISLVGAVCSCFFFVCFPLLFGKQTIGMKVFKLKFYYQNKKRNIFFSLLKHELFVWILIMLLSLTIGLTFSLVNYQDLELLNKGISGFNQQTDSFFYYLGLVYKSFYYIFFIIFFSIVVNLFVKNKQPLWHDKFSQVFVVQTKITDKQSSLSKTKKSINSKTSFNLPGDVNTSTLDELESEN